MLKELEKSYAGVFKIFCRYWRAYGGWKAVAYSVYFHAAILLTLMLHHLWLNADWYQIAIGVLPNMVGFAIGGYAIWLGFGDAEFKEVITTRDAGEGSSIFVQISASFAHFILVQLLALLFALVAEGLAYPLTKENGLGRGMYWVFGRLDFVHEYLAPIGNGLGFLLFMYAITTAIAASMSVFRLTSMIEK